MNDRDEWDADDEGWKDEPAPPPPAASEPDLDPDAGAPTEAIPVEGDEDYLGPEYDEDLDHDGDVPVGPPPPGGYEGDGGGGNRRWLLVTALIAVLLLGVAAAVVVASGDDDDDRRETADEVDTDSSTTSTTRPLGLPGAATSSTLGVPATTSTTAKAGGGTGSTTSTTRRAAVTTTTAATVQPLDSPCGPRGVTPNAPEANKPARIQICTDSLPAKGTSMKFYVNVVDEDATISPSCVSISFEGEPYKTGCAAHAPTGSFNDTLSFNHTFAQGGTYTVRAAVVSEPGTAKGSAAEATFTFTVV